MLTHSKFMLQMSIQQWWGLVVTLQTYKIIISTILHQRMKLKIHITETNVKISAHSRNKTCSQSCNIAWTQKLRVTTILPLEIVLPEDGERPNFWNALYKILYFQNTRPGKIRKRTSLKPNNLVHLTSTTQLISEELSQL